MNNTDEERKQERELRLLLEYGTPDLAAPQDRIGQIRRRVVRRRRRRRLALLAAVTSVVATAGLLGALRTAGPVAGRQQGVQVSAPQQTSTTTLIDDLGLTLTTRNVWHTLTTTDSHSAVTVFAANRPLTDMGVCTETAASFSCSPVDRLAAGEVLIAFRQEEEPHTTRGKKAFEIAKMAEPSDSCRRIGGDQQLMGWGSVINRLQRPTINAYVCLRRASQATIDQVRELLTTASLSVVTPSATGDDVSPANPTATDPTATDSTTSSSSSPR